jgi:hypothetical protein
MLAVSAVSTCTKHVHLGIDRPENEEKTQLKGITTLQQIKSQRPKGCHKFPVTMYCKTATDCIPNSSLTDAAFFKLPWRRKEDHNCSREQKDRRDAMMSPDD